MASGLSGDAVTAACLATGAPVVVAPAMDGEMYGHPATRTNVARLRDDFGYRIVEPEAGPLASGQSSRGRLAETASIVDAVVAAVAGRPVRAPDPQDRPPVVAEAHDADLEGRHIVISAGGTVEPIDPVRFIGNRSTGKMGVALAQAALDRGARVTLVAGQISVALPSSDSMLVFRAETTEDMGGLVRAAIVEADALIMAAAVADFRPRETATTKLGREQGLSLELEPTEDILAGVAAAIPPVGDPTRPISSASPRRPARSIGPRTSSCARGSTSSSRTTSPRRDRASGPTRTTSGSCRPTAGRSTCRCARSARSPRRSWTAWWPRWTRVTEPRRLSRRHRRPSRECHSRDRSPPDGRRHRQAPCRRPADRDADRL
jgi:hypothetical protein